MSPHFPAYFRTLQGEILIGPAGFHFKAGGIGFYGIIKESQGQVFYFFQIYFSDGYWTDGYYARYEL